MDSFEEVYELYFKDVYRYILSLCRNATEAEEITQETFFKAMKNMSTFRGSCKMTVWLCQIAKHIYFAERKEQKRRLDTTVHLQNAMEQFPDNVTTGKLSGQTISFSPELMLCDEADAMRIHEFLHQLEEPYKEVFMLRIFGELSFKKIAHIFGKTESWARVTYHRAKAKIICEMEESNGKDNV